MVDWPLAGQIARLASGSEERAAMDVDLDELSARSVSHLGTYTGLTAAAPLPPAEPVTRSEWAEANVEGLARMLAPVAERLEGRMAFAGPFAEPLRRAAGVTLAAEVGLIVGYLSQRVLGQYELALLEPALRPRLLFVTPNLERMASEPGVDRESFMEWVVLHEVTHALQFSGVPWLREHLGSLLREYLETVDVRVARGAAGGLPSMPDPAKLVETFREGGLVALVQSPEQRRLMDRLQAAMAVVEGYSEHTMDAVGSRVLPDYDGLREAMERRRRSRSAPERVLQRLLGLDLKLRQYELGKSFCDAVVARHGIEGLNRVWEAPEALPSLAELDHPDGWAGRVVARTAPERLARG